MADVGAARRAPGGGAHRRILPNRHLLHPPHPTLSASLAHRRCSAPVVVVHLVADHLAARGKQLLRKGRAGQRSSGQGVAGCHGPCTSPTPPHLDVRIRHVVVQVGNESAARQSRAARRGGGGSVTRQSRQGGGGWRGGAAGRTVAPAWTTGGCGRPSVVHVAPVASPQRRSLARPHR